MADLLPDGLYDQIITDELSKQIAQHRADHLTLVALGEQAAPQRLVDALSEQLGKILLDLPAGHDADEARQDRQTRIGAQTELINGLLVGLRQQLHQRYPEGDHADGIRLLSNPARRLTSIHRERPAPTLPDIGVAAP